MPIGRPRAPGTDEERAEARRAKVRVNVQAFRKRQRGKKIETEAKAKARREQDQSGKLQVSDLSDTSLSADSLRSSPMSSEPLAESDYADPDSWIWYLSQELVSYSEAHDDFLASAESEFYAAQVCQDLLGYDFQERIAGCTSWLNSALMELGRGSGLVASALMASALIAVGQYRNNPEVTLTGAHVQSRAIRRLRIAVQQLATDEVPHCTSVLSLAGLMCAMSELLASQSWTRFSNHLTGIGALLQCGGPERLQTPVARHHFFGYRSLQVAFSLTYGQETFLSEEEWLNPPWKTEVPTSKHPLHTLLDIAYQVVPEIAKARLGRSWHLSELREQLRRLREIWSQLDDWEQNLNLQHQGMLISYKRAEWRAPHSLAIDFATLPGGIAYSMFTGVRIKMACVMNRVLGDIVAADGLANVDTTSTVLLGLRWSRVALQCLEYFHTGSPKATGYISMLFPLDAAWEYLSCIEVNLEADVSEERGFCLATAQRLSKMNIPVFRWR